MPSLVDKIVQDTGYSRCVVSALVALSFPMRSTLITFFNTYKAIIIAEKAKIIGIAAKADVVATEINTVVQAGRSAVAPINTVLNAIPFEQLAQNCPQVVTDIKQVVDNIPTTIPANVVTKATGIASFDVFSGVTNYKTMQNKLNELAFKSQRATTASAYASKASSDMDSALNIIDEYLDIFSRMQ